VEEAGGDGSQQLRRAAGGGGHGDVLAWRRRVLLFFFSSRFDFALGSVYFSQFSGVSRSILAGEVGRSDFGLGPCISHYF
jgi:hypothetical protein